MSPPPPTSTSLLCLLVCFKLHSAHCTDLVGRKNGCNGVSSNGGHHVNQGHAHPADGLERAKSTGGKKTGSGCDKGEEKWETCIPPKTPTKTHTRHTHSHTHTLSHSHTLTLTHTHTLSLSRVREARRGRAARAERRDGARRPRAQTAQ